MVAGVQGVIGALAANVPAGVITTLPDPSITPTFTTVPWNPIPLDAATAAQLNAVFNNADPSQGDLGYNVILQLADALYDVPCLSGIQAAGGNYVPAACDPNNPLPVPNPFFQAISSDEAGARTIVYVEGNNPVLILDENLTALSLPTPTGDVIELPQLRQTTENDKVSFGASVLLGTVLNNDPNQVWGVSVPAGDNWILTAEEISTLQSQLVAANDLFPPQFLMDGHYLI